MQRHSNSLILILVALSLLVSGCATNNQVVQKGIFQHRKYNHPGWFVSMPLRESHTVTRVESSGARSTLPRKKVPMDSTATQQVDAPMLIDAPQVPVTERVMKVTKPGKKNVENTEASTSKLSNTLKDLVEQADRIFSSEKLLTLSNALVPATPSNDVAGIDIFALLGFIFAFVFPIAGLVLSIIGLNRTKGGGQGHGLALAGVIISIVFIVVYGAVFLR